MRQSREGLPLFMDQVHRRRQFLAAESLGRGTQAGSQSRGAGNLRDAPVVARFAKQLASRPPAQRLAAGIESPDSTLGSDHKNRRDSAPQPGTATRSPLPPLP